MCYTVPFFINFLSVYFFFVIKKMTTIKISKGKENRKEIKEFKEEKKEKTMTVTTMTTTTTNMAMKMTTMKMTTTPPPPPTTKNNNNNNNNKRKMKKKEKEKENEMQSKKTNRSISAMDQLHILIQINALKAYIYFRKGWNHTVQNVDIPLISTPTAVCTCGLPSSNIY